MTEPNFVSGNISTKYLNQVYPEGFKGEKIVFLSIVFLYVVCYWCLANFNVSQNIQKSFANHFYLFIIGKQLTELETEHLASLCGCIFVRHEVRSRHFLNQPQ